VRDYSDWPWYAPSLRSRTSLAVAFVEAPLDSTEQVPPDFSTLLG